MKATRTSRKRLATAAPAQPWPAAGVGTECAGGLVIGVGGDWFRAVEGPMVKLDGATPLRRFLKALAEYRITAPGVPLSFDFMFMTAWPGTLPSSEEVARRVQGSVSSLQSLGIRDALVSMEDAVFLDPALTRVVRQQD